MARKKDAPAPPPSEARGGYTVLELHVQAVKRIKAVAIEALPPAGTVEIAGRNGQGKSSALDAILMALGGKGAAPAKPIRDGEATAKETVVLQDAQGCPAFRVIRTFTAQGSYLKVQRATGEEIRSPQEFLDRLVGAGLGFDPLAFVRERPAEQVRLLLDVLKLERDPRELDAERKRLFEERTQVNRDVKRVEAQLEGIPVVDAPAEEVSIAGLTTEHGRLTEQDKAATRARSAWEEARREHDRCLAERARLAKALEDIESAAREAGAEVLRRAEAMAKTPPPDFTEISRRMIEAEEINAAVRLRREREAAGTELGHHAEAAHILTEQIRAIEEEQRALLEGAAFPVPGLGFEEISGEWGVTYQRIPLEQIGDSEKIRVGMAMAMALTPSLRVALIREGSLLDETSRQVVDTMARAGAFQVWLEVVGDGGAEAFVIEDGGVLRAPGRLRATTEPPW